MVVSEQSILEICRDFDIEVFDFSLADRALVELDSFPSKKDNALTWFGGEILDDHQAKLHRGFVLLKPGLGKICRLYGISFIEVRNPRQAFALASNLIVSADLKLRIRNQETISKFEGTYIHPTAVIDKDVQIGVNCEIGPGTVIWGGTKIGSNVSVGPNCVIGKSGFGFEQLPDKTWIRVPHVGSVLIHDNVDIGASAVVDRGTFGSTTIGSGVKIDNLVHIAHNVAVDENTLIAACSEISGGVRIGKSVWISPNCSVIQKVTIGDLAVVGLGSVVIRDVPSGTTVVGNPAKPLIKEHQNGSP